MKKIYSFITAALATFAINANAASLSGIAYYYSNSNSEKYTTDSIVSFEGSVSKARVTITNYLGSGVDLVVNCFEDGNASLISSTDATSDYTIGTLATVSSVDWANDADFEWWREDDDAENIWLWVGAYCASESGKAGGAYFGTPIKVPSQGFAPLFVDSRIKDTYFYSPSYKEYYNIAGYNYGGKVVFTDFTEYYSGEPLTLTITENADGTKSVASNVTKEPGYYWNSDLGDYVYLYKSKGFEYGKDSAGNEYVRTAGYAGYYGEYEYLYFYLPTDDWAGKDAIDTWTYTYGYTDRQYTDYQKVSVKWDLDNSQLLIPDFLGSKQDLLVRWDGQTIKGHWSLSDYWSIGVDKWSSDYGMLYDDSDEPQLKVYPWFDEVSPVDLMLYPAYGGNYLDSEYEDVILCAWADYATDDQTTHPSQYEYYYFYLPSSLSAVKDVVVAEEDSEAPVEYFNLQGVRVANPQSGLYIKRQGSKASKVLVK
jgi:hypothetical protein